MKGQTAFKFLITYGWAILIVVVVMGALLAFGCKPCVVEQEGQFEITINDVELECNCTLTDEVMDCQCTNNKLLI